MKIRTLVAMIIIFYLGLIALCTVSIYNTKKEYDKLNTIHNAQYIEMTAFMKSKGNNAYLESLLLTEKEIEILNENIDRYLLYIYTIMIVATISFIFAYMGVRKKILKPVYDMNKIIIKFQNGFNDVKEIKSNDDEIGLMIKEFFIMKNKLDKDYEEIQKLASTDPLTNILNRRAFFEISDSITQLAFRNNQTFSVLILDIDYFKQVNDTYGHLIGDEVLKYLVTKVQAEIRASDLFARFGGEEFIVLMPETDQKGAFVLAEKIRNSIEVNPYEADNLSIEVTVSIGLAQLKDEKLLEALIKRADEALYSAKEAGRNKVEQG